MKEYEDITGERFGRLIALGRVPRKNDKKRYDWECKCDCGNITNVKLSDLKRRKVLSCGCLNRENTLKRNKKFNEYSVKNGIVEVILFNSESCMICDEDIWNQYKDTCWRININGYAVGTVNGKPNVQFHKLVLYQVSHKRTSVSYLRTHMSIQSQTLEDLYIVCLHG